MASKTVTELQANNGMATNAEMLNEINNAILCILKGGQSYTIGSRRLTRADLSQLYKMRQEIEAGIAADDNASGLFDDCFVAIWDIDPR